MKKCFQVTEKWRFMKGQGKRFLIDDRTMEKTDDFFFVALQISYF